MTQPAEIEGDVAFTLAKMLLGRVYAGLTVKPARSFVSDGALVPGDECCDGLLWVRVAQIAPSNGDGQPPQGIPNWGIPVSGHTVTLEVGILRCVAAPLDEQGRDAPTKDIQADALQAALDRSALRYAILCAFPADIANLEDDQMGGDGQLVGPWLPLSAGTCGGGWMTTTIGYTGLMDF